MFASGWVRSKWVTNVLRAGDHLHTQLWSSSDQPSERGKGKIVSRWNSSIVGLKPQQQQQHSQCLWQLLDSVNWTWKVWRLFDLQNLLCAKCAIYHSSLPPPCSLLSVVATLQLGSNLRYVVNGVPHQGERLWDYWRQMRGGSVTLFRRWSTLLGARDGLTVKMRRLSQRRQHRDQVVWPDQGHPTHSQLSALLSIV